ncbi:MAG TPA: acyltransferase [Bdellovibrionota bacterium]|nr:acyltransferase [Bdellovibrionota bacterium]
MLQKNETERGILKGFVPDFLKQGWTGVDLFFVISGFLVTRSFASWLEHAGKYANLKVRLYLAFRYCQRRLVRILPPAWLWAFIPAIASLLFNRGGGFGSPSELLSESLAVVRFQYNYFAVSTGFGNISHFWSLAVEEHYYLFPPLFLLIIRGRISRIAGLLFIAALCFVNRAHAWKTGAGFGEISFLTHFRADGLALGCILGLIAAQIQMWSRKYLSAHGVWLSMRVLVILAVAYLWISPSLFDRDQVVYFGYLSFAVISALLVALASSGMQVIPCPSYFRKGVAAIGRRSYTLYLIHVPIILAVREGRYRVLEMERTVAWETWFPAMIELGIFLVALAILTELNYRLLECPLIEFGKTRFGESRLSFDDSFQKLHV